MKGALVRALFGQGRVSGSPAGRGPGTAPGTMPSTGESGRRRGRRPDAEHGDHGPGRVPTPTDPDALEYRRRRRQARDRQEVVRDLASVSRGQPVSEVAATLRRALAARLRTRMPRTWVDAVARDAAAGHVYIVDEVAQQDAGVELRRTGKD